jgi:PKD repeat protein
MDLRELRLFSAIVLAGTAAAGCSPATDAPQSAATRASALAAPRPVILKPTRTDSFGPLRDRPMLPPQKRDWVPSRKLLPNRTGNPNPGAPDPVLQDYFGDVVTTPTPTSFEGIGNVNGVLPPDTNADVGPNHVVQTVNLSFAIWDKSGTLLYGPADNSTLWAGFGGPCENTNDGDPIVLYDHLADRWLMSQFALPNFPNGPFYQCIAISQTGDPTGAWYRYEYLYSNTKLNDYPKFGVWPDGYYMAVNQFTCSILGCSWAGQGVAAFEREKMLLGLEALGIKFDLYLTDPNLGGMLPADLDGPAPPMGAPGLFGEMDDNAWGYSPDQLQLWEFVADWTNPSSSTFTHLVNLATAAFDSNMCGYARNCIPQPGTTTKLDAISDRLMYRLQYRNFGSYQTMVVNHAVDANGADRAGIRWYELRNTGSGWFIYQQGTYSPDSNHRWMGSIAMNGLGEIALGFSVSSSTVFPSIRGVGRLASDPLGTLPQGEFTIIAGSGSQTHTAGRWGDYSSMSVDPVDDCTFWYTQEYYSSTSSAGWRTRIGSFKISDCGPVNNAPTVSIVEPAEGSTLSGTVNIRISASDAEDAAGTLTVQWNLDGDTWQTAAYNMTTGFYEATWDTTAASEGTHMINARATDSGGKTATDSNAVTVNNVNDSPGASFTYSCSGLACTFDGSGSSDPDGTIVSYAWAFGDGTMGSSGVTTSHTYASAGTYTVTLTVTDNGGATGTASQTVTVNLTMHIGDLDPSTSSSGGRWSATVTITVHGSSHNAVANATVSGTWNNGQASSCTTNASGQCSVSRLNMKRNVQSTTFTVNGVTHATLTYQASANHDPDGDSNGTSITVTRP